MEGPTTNANLKEENTITKKQRRSERTSEIVDTDQADTTHLEQPDDLITNQETAEESIMIEVSKSSIKSTSTYRELENENRILKEEITALKRHPYRKDPDLEAENIRLKQELGELAILMFRQKNTRVISSGNADDVARKDLI